MALAASSVGLSILAGPTAVAATGGDQTPGVTPTRIVTGAVATQSGPLAGDLAGLIPGVRAYFDMVNAAGGVAGRRIDLAYDLDDGGNPSQFVELVRNLIDQDHVFAITGVGTDFFTSSVLVQNRTPTFGFNSTGGWAGAPNLFGSDGSVQCYSCLVPFVSYLAHRVKATSLAFLAYDVSASSALCAAAASLLAGAGFHVAYEDLHAPIDGDMTPDVQRMARTGSQLVVSCMDVDGNVSMARAIQQYGMHTAQLWFSGYDQSVIDAYHGLMQGVYFFLPNVPLSAPLRDYPGLTEYVDAMRRYEPKYVDAALAPQGWASAALFVAGLRAVGRNLTQGALVAAVNRLTHFTDGLSPPTDWSHGHVVRTYPAHYPVCAVFSQVRAAFLRTVFTTGHRVFTCLDLHAYRDPSPVAAPPGTPGG